ncbi:TetR family transcriptional regulator C-terminal domain-containing protein [Roseovarius sp. SCSIO 43702]|uniref:TetR family transcriptional regulator C-terminal domain-containing protein n=1 Tax=Roseovarius sp. SCSIO 43702 TaxID=2823043 RepID=UPI001C72C594|nr:TetR family transcriptional regulator C-terminal domain-containing protein [Roseovarius sp. SCSIO 43702]QYX56549.1 TetR family transcriptional regulator C-terminal domain-containing protein [Roseovarius sp. SCSIO 43702]
MSKASVNLDTGQRPVRRTASREVRRRQLIDATIESISRHGIPGTTMTTVTGIAGLSLGLVNFHFKTKRALFEETLRHLADEYLRYWRGAIAAAGEAPEARLAAMARAQFHPDLCNRRKLTVWFAFYGDPEFRGAYREVMSSVDEERWEASSALCAEICEAGGYDAVTPRDVAVTLEGMYDGFWLNMLLYPEEFGAEDARARVAAYLAAIFPRHFGAGAE